MSSLRNRLGKNNVTFQLQLQDKGLTANRMIEEHRFFSNGDAMTLKNSLSNYIVKIRKNVFVEEDPRKSCKNYPNAEFSSYAECDDQYMREKIDQVAPGLTPPWLTRDLDRLQRWSFFCNDGMVMFFFQGTIAIDGFSMVLPALDHHH